MKRILEGFFSDWVPIGPEWKTETVFQVRELLRSEQINFKMPFSDIFFTSVFHLPAEDKRWSVLVRRNDWKRTVTLLAQEGLVSREMLIGDGIDHFKVSGGLFMHP